MTTAKIRERLHDYIDVAEDKKIKAIYEILEAQITEQKSWWEDEDTVAEFDDRVKRFEAGTDSAYTWAEVEASIDELKKRRAGK